MQNSFGFLQPGQESTPTP